MSFERALREALDELGLSPSSGQTDAMCRHFALMRAWGRRMNLTGLRDPREIARRHFGESAFLHRELPALAAAVDVGSGAGFPGLPFAVLRPDTPVTLVESRLRKAAFLREAARECPNVSVERCRIERWQGRAEWALVRAVAPATVLPRLRGRARRVAFLGTVRPPSGAFGKWECRAMPWSERRRLWLSGSLTGVANRPA